MYIRERQRCDDDYYGDRGGSGSLFFVNTALCLLLVDSHVAERRRWRRPMVVGIVLRFVPMA